MNALRLSVGTLSVLPAGSPGHVDRDAWSRAMMVAPLVGLVLGMLAAAAASVVLLIADVPLLAAIAAVATLAVLTRCLHLDGLADVADGLGSHRPAAEARAVMKKSDIGPFGVVTLVLVVLADVAALTVLADESPLMLALGVSGGALVSRTAITATCRRGVAPATGDGLGAAVAESVAPLAALTAVVIAVVVVGAAVAVGPFDSPGRGALAAVVAIAFAEAWRRHCSRRLGGVTGDVLGSVVEVSFTVFAVTLVLAAG